MAEQADKSAAAVWCHHVNLDSKEECFQNLVLYATKRQFPKAKLHPTLVRAFKCASKWDYTDLWFAQFYSVVVGLHLLTFYITPQKSIKKNRLTQLRGGRGRGGVVVQLFRLLWADSNWATAFTCVLFFCQSTVGIWFPYVHVNTLNSKGYLIKQSVRVYELHLKNELHFKLFLNL